MSTFRDKTVLVTGGGSGIGLAVARAFLTRQARVAIASRSADKLRQAAEGLGGGVLAHATDVADFEQVTALVAEVTTRLGPIDILVNNAGLNLKERSFRELAPENWSLLLDANLTGAFYCMKAVLPQMAQRGGGLIVNVNSLSGKRAAPLGGTAYNAAKFGLRGLAMSVAAEEKASGVRITSIYPGEVETPILEVRPQPVSTERRREMLQPEDIAEAVIFVASLPPRACVPELVITPTTAIYV